MHQAQRIGDKLSLQLFKNKECPMLATRLKITKRVT